MYMYVPFEFICFTNPESPTRRVDNEVFKFKLMLNLIETVPAYKPVLSQHQDFLSCDPHPR